MEYIAVIEGENNEVSEKFKLECLTWQKMSSITIHSYLETMGRKFQVMSILTKLDLGEVYIKLRDIKKEK